ncbi:MAG TPA: GntR family transcriptional regulator [Acidisoma sp.]|jgi:DNA-binding GntR family transcriptional regulator|nr:GntR family transcriptional regulator [Acidisoma sp.]
MPNEAANRSKAAADTIRRDSVSYQNAVNVVSAIVAERHDRPSLVSQIACEIGAEIIENILPEGEDLNSVELAQRYNTSRTPVREALMLLEKEGLVDIPPRRRPRVTALDFQEVRDIYHVRAVLFTKVAADMIERGTPEHFVALRDILGKMKEAAAAVDHSAYLWSSVDFYNQLTEAAKNRVAKRIMDSLLLRTLKLRRLSMQQPKRLELSISDHVQLVSALGDGDTPLAAAIIRSNHLHALAALEAYHAQHGHLHPMPKE